MKVCHVSGGDGSWQVCLRGTLDNQLSHRPSELGVGLRSYMGVFRITEASGEAGQGRPSPLGCFRFGIHTGCWRRGIPESLGRKESSSS